MATGKRVKNGGRPLSAGTIAVIVLASVTALVVIGFLGLGAYVSGRDTIYPNITVNGIDVGGMSRDAAHSKLLTSGIGVPSGVEATVELTGRVSITVTSDEAGSAASVTEAVDAAYNYGRNGGFFTKLSSFLGCISKSHEVYTPHSVNEAGIRAIVADAAQRANHPAAVSSYTVTGTKLVMTKGGESYTVDEDGVFLFIRDTLLSGRSASTKEFSEENTAGSPGESLDFDAIYNEVYVEPVDAVYDPETQSVSGGTSGVSLDKEGAKAAFDAAGPGETVEFDLTVTPPGVTAGQMENMLFADKLAEKTTTLSTSSANRINNISLAAQAFNGLILNPGEEFSFNGVVGERTSEKGYKPAGAFANGTTVDEVGGGICQVSSTLYFCTLKADLEILVRECHGMAVAYIPAGFDATVYWPSQDFKFANNRNYPIKLVAYVDDNGLTIEIWGTKENDITVMLESNIDHYIAPNVQYVEDDTLAPGEKKVRSYGVDGFVSLAYKIYVDGNGNEIKRELLSKDTYIPQGKTIIAVGPEPETEPPTDEPTDEPPVPPTEPPTDTPTEEPPTEEPPTEPPTEEEPPETPSEGEDTPGEGDTDPGSDVTTPQG